MGHEMELSEDGRRYGIFEKGANELWKRGGLYKEKWLMCGMDILKYSINSERSSKRRTPRIIPNTRSRS
jgi:hypothetical protein